MADDYAELVKRLDAEHVDRMTSLERNPDDYASNGKLAARAIEALVKENAQLSAGQCIVNGGLLLGDGGHAYCALVKENKNLRTSVDWQVDRIFKAGHEAGIREALQIAEDHATTWEAKLIRDAILALINKPQEK